MRASIIYFVMCCLLYGPIICAFPSAMNSMITVTPSKKSSSVKSNKGNVINRLPSSTDKPPMAPFSTSTSSSPLSAVSGSSHLPSLSSHVHPTPLSGALHPTHPPHFADHNKSSVTAFQAKVEASSAMSNRSSDSLLPLIARKVDRKKKINMPASATVAAASAKSNAVAGRGRGEDKMTTESINQWTDHVNVTTRGEVTNSLLSRVKRRGARGGGFGNAGRKGPRDRLDYRKNEISHIKPAHWPIIIVTISTILPVLFT